MMENQKYNCVKGTVSKQSSLEQARKFQKKFLQEDETNRTSNVFERIERIFTQTAVWG